jgi:hypothetical protein
MNIFRFVSISEMPLSCVFPGINFHHRLVYITVMPIVFVFAVAVMFVFRRRQLRSMEKTDDEILRLESKCIHIVILFMFSIFAVVSKTIVESFKYDTRLEAETGDAYLLSDYSIRRDDPEHEAFVVYAGIMFCFYCLGIPVASYLLLRANLESIQKLQLNNYEIQLVEKELADVNLYSQVKGFFSRSSMERLEVLKKELNERYQAKEDLLADKYILKGMSSLYRDYEVSLF